MSGVERRGLTCRLGGGFEDVVALVGSNCCSLMRERKSFLHECR